MLNMAYLNFINNSDWILLLLAAFTLGLGKSGIKGIGVITVILMVLVFGSKESTGALLPMMIFADVFAVIYYNKHTQWYYLKKLIPMMFLGVIVGVWWGDSISEKLFKEVMSVFILVTVAIMIWMELKKTYKIPKHWIFSGGMGWLSGFTSMIGNLAGPFSNIYFLAMRLPKNEFIGTAAWLFFIINVFKLPFHIFVWKTIDKQTLTINAVLIPTIVLGFYLGAKLVKVISNELYRKFVLLITAAGAIFILFK